MNRQLQLAVIGVFVSLSFGGEASAFHSAHLGRFISRDPYGDALQRTSMEMPAETVVTTRFMKRKHFFAQEYPDGMNLYNYVLNIPTALVDPFGFGPFDGLGDHLKKFCDKLPPAARKDCKDEVDDMLDDLEDIRQEIEKEGGASRFRFNGPVCDQCESKCFMKFGSGGGNFWYNTKTKSCGPDHVWGEFEFHPNPNDKPTATGSVACTIDFWGRPSKPWDPSENGMGWIPDEDLPPYVPPPYNYLMDPAFPGP